MYIKKKVLLDKNWTTSFPSQIGDLGQIIIDNMPSLNFYKSKLLIDQKYEKLDSFTQEINLQLGNEVGLRVGEIIIEMNLVNTTWNAKVSCRYSYNYIFFILVSLFFLLNSFRSQSIGAVLPAILFFAGFLLFLVLTISILTETEKNFRIFKNYLEDIGEY